MNNLDKEIKKLEEKHHEEIKKLEEKKEFQIRKIEEERNKTIKIICFMIVSLICGMEIFDFKIGDIFYFWFVCFMLFY